MDILQQVADLTKKRVQLKNEIARIEAKVKESLKPLKDKVEEIDAEVHNLRLESGQKKLSMDEGTWFEKNADKYTLTHKAQFIDWLIERQESHGDAMDFVSATMVKSALDGLVKETKVVPEWVKYSPAIITQFRTAAKK